MIRREEPYTDQQIIGTRVENTNIGYAIFIEVQGKTVKLEFRDDGAFDFVDQLVRQAEEARTGEDS